MMTMAFFAVVTLSFFLLFILFNRLGLNRGFDFYSFSRLGVSLIQGEGLSDLFGPHTHFPPVMAYIYALLRFSPFSIDLTVNFFQATIFSLQLFLFHKHIRHEDKNKYTFFFILLLYALSKHFITVNSAFTSEPLYFLLLLIAIRPFEKNREISITTKQIIISSLFLSLAFYTKPLAVFHFGILSLLLFIRKDKKKIVSFIIPFTVFASFLGLRNFYYQHPLSGRLQLISPVTTFNFHDIPRTMLEILFDFEGALSPTLNTVFYILVGSIVLLLLHDLKNRSFSKRSIIDQWHLLSFLLYLPFILLCYTFIDPSIRFDPRLALPLFWHFLYLGNDLLAPNRFPIKARRPLYAFLFIFVCIKLYQMSLAFPKHIKAIETFPPQRFATSTLPAKLTPILKIGRPLVYTNGFRVAVMALPDNCYIEEIENYPNTSRQCSSRQCYLLDLNSEKYYLPSAESFKQSLKDSVQFKEILSDDNGSFSQITVFSKD